MAHVITRQMGRRIPLLLSRPGASGGNAEQTASMTTETDHLMTTEQAARYLGVSASFLAKARVSGTPSIPFTRIGVAVRYTRADLDAHVAANRRHSTSATANAA